MRGWDGARKKVFLNRILCQLFLLSFEACRFLIPSECPQSPETGHTSTYVPNWEQEALFLSVRDRDVEKSVYLLLSLKYPPSQFLCCWCQSPVSDYPHSECLLLAGGFYYAFVSFLNPIPLLSLFPGFLFGCCLPGAPLVIFQLINLIYKKICLIFRALECEIVTSGSPSYQNSPISVLQKIIKLLKNRNILSMRLAVFENNNLFIFLANACRLFWFCITQKNHLLIGSP